MEKADEQLNLVNYEVEEKKLNEALNRPEFWNPNAGKYELVILSEMENYEYTDKEDKVQKRAKVLIEVAGKQYTWSFGIGITKASLYGQLIDHARKHDNKLAGSKITLVVKSDGKKRDFTVV